MQLRITTDYAIRLLLCLGVGSARKTAEELSEEIAIPKPSVIKIMARLKGKGWVAAQEGMRGGYVLKVPLSSITLLEILQTMEETIRINRCIDEDEYCSRFATRNCPMRNAYVYLQDILEGLLWSLTLEKVVEGDLSALDAAHAIACISEKNKPRRTRAADGK